MLVQLPNGTWIDREKLKQITKIVVLKALDSQLYGHVPDRVVIWYEEEYDVFDCKSLEEAEQLRDALAEKSQ
jgi:hypothetical protein